MKTWLNWKRKRGLDVEAELRAARPKAPDSLVKSIVGLLNPRPAQSRGRMRYGFVGALAAASLALLGAFGGLSYAASGVVGAFQATADAVHFKGFSTHSALKATSAAGNQYGVAPRITSAAPPTAIGGHTVVNVAGQNIDPNSVTIAGIAVTPTSHSSTVVKFLAPVQAAGAVGPVVIHTDFGQASSPKDVTLVEVPATTSLSDTSLEAGQVITVHGTGFTATTAVNFLGGPKPVKAAGFTFVDDGHLSVTVPAGLPASGHVAITNAAGTTTSGETNAFTFTATAPTIVSFTPASGVADGQTGDPTVVTITGTNFDTTDTVYFGGVAAAPLSDGNVPNATHITVDAPANAVAGLITVTDTAGGSAVSKTPFTPIITPTVGTVTPSAAPATGAGNAIGKPMTIQGTHFFGVTAVVFPNSKSVAVKPAADGHSIVVPKVPAGTATGSLSISNAAGTVTTPFVLLVAPNTITFNDDTRAQPAIPGDQLTINGAGFNGATGVSIGKGTVSKGDFSTFTDTQIVLNLPSTATTGKVTVNSPAGNGNSTASLTMAAAPTIKTVTPTGIAIGQTSDPSTLTITGTGFTGVDDGGSTTVSFQKVGGGLTTGTVLTKNATTITVNAPANSTTGTVKVHTDAGDAISKSVFTPIKNPAPSNGTPKVDAGGDFGGKPGTTTIIITGTWLNGASATDTKVTFPGVLAAQVAKVTGTTSLSVKIPAGAGSGTLTITNAAGTGTITGFNAITAAPTVTGPTTFTHSTVVTINGSHFLGVTTIKLGSNVFTASAFIINGDSQISLTLPASTKTGTAKTLQLINVFGAGNVLAGITIN